MYFMEYSIETYTEKKKVLLYICGYLHRSTHLGRNKKNQNKKGTRLYGMKP